MTITIKKYTHYGDVYESEYEPTEDECLNFIADEYYSSDEITRDQFKIAMAMLDKYDVIRDLIEELFEKEFEEYIQDLHELDDVDEDDDILIEKGDGRDD